MLAFWLASLLSLIPPAAPAYAGYWLTADQDAVVEISQVGMGYTGRYVAFRKTPAAKKNRLQYQVLQDLRADGNALSGKVYNFDSGKDYRAQLTLTSPTTLELRVKVMGVTAHTETWTRQPVAK